MDNAINIAQAVVLFMVFFIGIIGNAIVLFVLLRQRKTWSITATYLFNLALADTLFLCVIPFWGHYYLNSLRWWFGLGMCKVAGGVTNINMYASIFFLTAMSVDRWLAVVHATQVSRFRTSVMVRWISIGIWCVSCLLSIPNMVYRKLIFPRPYEPCAERYPGPDFANGTNSTEEAFADKVSPLPTGDPFTTEGKLAYDQCIGHDCVCSFFLPIFPGKAKVMGAILFTKSMIGFVIPMIVISACYIGIVMTVKKKVISKRVKKDRVAKLAILVVTAFFVCWLPHHVLNLYSGFSGWWRIGSYDTCVTSWLIPFAICLAWGNSCINPIVYAFTTTNFQKSIKDMCANEKSVRPYKMTLSNPQHKDDKQSPAHKTQLVTMQTHAGRISPDNNGNHGYTQAVQVHVVKNAKDVEGVHGHPTTTAVPTSSEGQSFSYYSCPAMMQGLGKANSCSEASGKFGAYSTPEKNDCESCIKPEPV